MERSEIYRERKSLDDFGVDDSNNLGRALLNAILEAELIKPWEIPESFLLRYFNDAYYICTLILLEKRPYLKVHSYYDIAAKKYNTKSKERAFLVLGMVSAYLSSLDYISDDVERTNNMIKKDCSGFDGEVYEKLSTIQKDDPPTEATIFLPLRFPEGECSSYWENYKKFHIGLSDMVTQLSTDSSSKANNVFEAEKQKYEEKINNLEKQIKQLKNERNDYTKKQIDNDELMRKLAALELQINDGMRDREPQYIPVPEQAFNAAGHECFTKAKMGLLIYTMASICDGPIPIKKRLVPIISAIGGWEEKSVGSEMKKAGFNKNDIEALAELFKDAMPKFAAEIKKQAMRKPKTKK